MPAADKTLKIDDMLDLVRKLQRTGAADTATENTTALFEKIKAMSFLEFQDFVGLPEHPATLKPQPLTTAQVDFYNRFVDKAGDKKAWVHLNKARQCGWTECVLRILAYHGFHRYRGKKVGIIAGTNINTTKQIFQRLRELFRNIPDTIADEGRMYIRLHNGTEYYGGPAAVETFTGWTKFGAFFLDEAAKWNLVEDRPVLNAMLPIARSNRADVFMISTPKGPRGFFYHIAMDKDTPFQKAEYDIHRGGADLYTLKERQDMIDSSEEDPAQEYLCEFTIGRGSIWGFNTEEDRTNEYMVMDYDNLENPIMAVTP